MPFQPAPLVAKTELRMTWFEKQVEYVWHWRKTGGAEWSSGDLEALAENVFSYFTDQFQALMCSPTVFNSCYAVALFEEGGPAFEYFPPVEVAGTLAGEQVPNNLAICMTHRTARSGRSYRGRTYFGGFDEGSLLGNNVTEVYAGFVETGWDAFIAAMDLTSVALCILSRSNSGLPRVEGVGTLVTSSGLRNRRVDTQRRRLPAG